MTAPTQRPASDSAAAWTDPVTLEGNAVRLEPLTLEHLDPLTEVALDPELWRWTISKIDSRAGLERYLETAIREREQGRSLPFATIHRSSGRVIGSTRFGNIEPVHRRVEIGWTWIGTPWQRSAINTEAKYLMLQHAFERLGCIRVEFKTHALNRKSQNAMLRIGCTEEGRFRKHMIAEDGAVRDTVWFSIVDDEWPAVKARLEGFMRAHGA